jgi:hypothetical protein
MKAYIHLCHLAELLLGWQMFQAKFIQKIKTHILCSITFFRKSFRLWDNVEKTWYSQTGHRWQYNKAHALCMLDNQGYRHTLRIRNTDCFSMATMLTRTRLNVTLYVHWLPRLMSICYFGRHTVVEFGIRLTHPHSFRAMKAVSKLEPSESELDTLMCPHWHTQRCVSRKCSDASTCTWLVFPANQDVWSRYH